MITKASESPYKDIATISTGLPKLDKLTGIGGIPLRRITEISGPWSVGKTTLMLAITREAQEQGLRCLWCDVEWSWDERYAEALGVDTAKLGLIQERDAEAALDALETALEAKEYDVALLDSIGGLLPRQEAEKSVEGKVIGGQASIVAKFCRKIVPILAINNQALIVSNHQFVDIMTGRLKTSGGAKLEYHKSLHISLKKENKRIMQGEKVVGYVISAKIRKSKLSSTQEQECDLNLMFGEGFSSGVDLIEDALERGLLTKKGNTFYAGDEKLGMISKVRDMAADGRLAAKLSDATSTP